MCSRLSRCILIASLAFAQTPAPPVAGTWEGAIAAGAVKLRIGVAITAQPDGKLEATMDSPDQGAYGLRLSDVRFADGVLTFALRQANGTFEGRLNSAGTEIAGTWTQGGALPLVLKKVEKLARPARPQEPKPPFPYRSEHVAIANAAGQAVLDGTLTLPEGKGPFPAVVLITGSGAQNRDEEIFGHKPFLVLADHLTRHGIAVLRYDDRGVGKSTGDFASATSEDFAGDAWAAWQALAARPEIDPKRIGLVGHSEGGRHRADAGRGAPGDRLRGHAGRDGRHRRSGHDRAGRGHHEGERRARRRDRRQRGHTASGLRDPARGENDGAHRRATAGDPRARPERGLAGARASSPRRPGCGTSLLHDPAPALAKVRCPVLAIAGERDLQVLPDQNAPAIEKALKQGGNKDATVVRLPGLNHLLQPATTGLPAEYAQIETTIAPAALDAITTWIRARTGLAK